MPFLEGSRHAEQAEDDAGRILADCLAGSPGGKRHERDERGIRSMALHRGFRRRLCRTRVGGEPEGAGRVGIRQGVVALAVLLLCYGLGTQSGLVSSSFGTSVVDDGRFLLVLQALGVLLVVMWCMVPRMPVGTGIWRKATEPVLAAALSASLRRCAQVRPSCFLCGGASDERRLSFQLAVRCG